MALSISGGNGSVASQANTQTPQASVGPATNATSAGNVQHGTANSLLTTKTGGISLSGQALSVVDLGSATAGTSQSSQPEAAAPAKHHLNPILIGLAIALFVLVLIIFWLTSRSAKNTTV
jgi:hypothetical protein